MQAWGFFGGGVIWIVQDDLQHNTRLTPPLSLHAPDNRLMRDMEGPLPLPPIPGGFLGGE